MLDLLEAARGKAQVFVAAPAAYPYGSKFRNSATAFFELPTRKFDLVTFLKLIIWARKRQIQIIHSHGRGAGIFSRLMKLFGFKVVHSFHGIHPNSGVSAWIKSGLDLILNPLTDAFVFVSEGERQIAEKRSLIGDRSHIKISPGIRLNKNYLPPSPPRSPFKFGTLARLDRIKGIDVLLKKLAHFSRKNPNIDWRFFHAGEGPDMPVIPFEIKERVCFVGWVKEPSEFLKTINIYISASISEAFNISVLEAVSQGLPCLVSDIPGHRQFIDGEVATGFSLEDDNDFSEKLACLLYGRPFKPKTHKIFLEEFSAENQTNRYLNWIVDLSES